MVKKYIRLRENIRKKLLGNAGESMTETLAACMIAALSAAMLAGMVVSSARTVQKSQKAFSEHAQLMEKFWSSEEPESSRDVQLDFGSFQLPVRLDRYALSPSHTDVIYEFSSPDEPLKSAEG